MPKASRTVIDTMRKTHLDKRRPSTATTGRKANVEAAFFTKAEIQAFLNQLPAGEDVMVHLVALDNDGPISIAMVGHKDPEEMGISSATGVSKSGRGISTARDGIYSATPCPPKCKENITFYIVN
jgi:hypothetical protein